MWRENDFLGRLFNLARLWRDKLSTGCLLSRLTLCIGLFAFAKVQEDGDFLKCAFGTGATIPAATAQMVVTNVPASMAKSEHVAAVRIR
jgi:hypothetical protein